MTGGSGALGRAAIPILRARGLNVEAPDEFKLDLFARNAVTSAVAGVDSVLHLATRIPPRDRAGQSGAWNENDRLRAEASRLLVDAALSAGTETYVQPSVTFLYPAGRVDEETELGEVPEHLRSAVAAEGEAARFAAAGRRGVVLRFGLLDGPGTGNDLPDRRYGATLHVGDAGQALAVALDLQSGVYNACRDGERVSNERLRRAGWRPTK